MFIKTKKLEINRYSDYLEVSLQLQQMLIATVLADNIISLMKMLVMFKISCLCLINSTKETLSLILNLSKHYKFCLFSILNMSSIAQLLLLDIYHHQE